LEREGIWITLGLGARCETFSLDHLLAMDRGHRVVVDLTCLDPVREEGEKELFRVKAGDILVADLASLDAREIHADVR
jgi:hypothetical protein